MHQYITLEKFSPDGLSGVRWRFYLLNERLLVVDAYEEFSRESKRHKPRTDRFWSRLNGRDSRITKAEVPLTPEVMAEAKEALIKLLTEQLRVDFQA